MCTLYVAFGKEGENEKQKKRKKQTTKLYVAFIDFKKAYDIVNRDISCMVLFTYGVRGQMFRILGAFTP